MKYKDFNDFELLSYVGEHNEEASEILYQKYQPLIHSMATKMYSQIRNKSGIELSDLIQEGMLGLTYAMNSFDEKNGAMFFTYARTCIERRMISMIIGSQRLKHKILNESISYNAETDRQEQITIDTFLLDNSMNPELLLLNSEEEKELQKKIDQGLSLHELQVLELKIAGFTYEEIAKLLGITKKKVDNTIQRIRYKLKSEREK